jgi:thiol-disulfide isomerase/thioredoxin
MHKFFLAAVLLALVPLAAARAEEPQKAKTFDLSFTAVDGKTVDFTKLRGKVVLLDFWATWCAPCRAEIPNIVKVYNKYHSKGFEVVGISLDQDKNAMMEFADIHGMMWPQYFDGQGWDNEISSSLGIDQIPAMFLIGKDGRPIPSNGKSLDEAIADALKT